MRSHPERGVAILDRLAEELAEFAIVEQRPLQDGRNMTMMLGPSKAVLAGQFDKLTNGAAAADLVAGEANGAVAAATTGDDLAVPSTNGDAPAPDAAEAPAAAGSDELAAPPEGEEVPEVVDAADAAE